MSSREDRVLEWYHAQSELCKMVDEKRELVARIDAALQRLDRATLSLAEDARFDEVRYLKVPGTSTVLRVVAKSKDRPEVEAVTPVDA